MRVSRLFGSITITRSVERVAVPAPLLGETIAGNDGNRKRVLKGRPEAGLASLRCEHG